MPCLSLQKTNFNRSQIFGYKNGIPVVVEKKGSIPLASTVDIAPTSGEAEEMEQAADFVPAWVAFDRKVLRCVQPLAETGFTPAAR